MSDVTPENEYSTPPVPVAGYPLNDVPPNATGGEVYRVPNVHDQVAPAMDDAFAREARLLELQRTNADLLARLERLEKPAAVSAPVSAVAGGEPDPHHLHLVDGRVIENHGGIGTHYSETLPDGSTKITRIRAFYPVNEISPVATLS